MLDDLFHGSGIMAITFENFVAYGHSTTAYYQRNVYLLAVRSVIPGISSLCQFITRGFSFEVGAGHIV
jgi:hypothetical protein